MSLSNRRASSAAILQCSSFDFLGNWSCLSQERLSIGFLLASIYLDMLIIKLRSNERRRSSNKDDFRRSKAIPSSAAILIARYIYAYEHEAIRLPKTENHYRGGFGAPKSRGAPAPPNFELLAGPMVIIHTKLTCRFTCSECWALDSDLVCPMHRQLTPNHAQQIVWVYTLVIPGTVH